MNKNLLWKASNTIIESSNIFKFSKKVENKFNVNFKKTLTLSGIGVLKIMKFFGQNYGIFQI